MRKWNGTGVQELLSDGIGCRFGSQESLDGRVLRYWLGGVCVLLWRQVGEIGSSRGFLRSIASAATGHHNVDGHWNRTCCRGLLIHSGSGVAGLGLRRRTLLTVFDGLAGW